MQEQAANGAGLLVWRKRSSAVRWRPSERETGGGQTDHGAVGTAVRTTTFKAKISIGVHLRIRKCDFLFKCRMWLMFETFIIIISYHNIKTFLLYHKMYQDV